MQKILISIANYGTKQLQCLKRVLEEFESYKEFDLTINVHTTVELNEFKGINTKIYPESIGRNLVFEHRKEFTKEVNNYDIFLFMENDVIIPEKSVKLFCEHDKIIPGDCVIGFIRYEKWKEDDEENNFILDEMSNLWGVKQKDMMFNNKPYFSIVQDFQSCYLLTRDKLNLMLSPYYLSIVDKNLEAGSAGIFKSYGGKYQKVIPQNKEELRNCMIYHVSNKYIHKQCEDWSYKKLLDTLGL